MMFPKYLTQWTVTVGALGKGHLEKYDKRKISNSIIKLLAYNIGVVMVITFVIAYIEGCHHDDSFDNAVIMICQMSTWPLNFSELQTTAKPQVLTDGVTYLLYWTSM